MLTGVHVKASRRAGAIVVLGDSITDGVGSSVDANRRWPDMLSERLQGRPNLDQLAVLNQGIIGNRLLRPGTGAVAQLLGAAGLARFDRDVVAQPGVRYLIVLLGINDIGAPPSEAVTVEELIAGYRQLIERAHQRGITIFGATLLPFEGTTMPGFYTPEGEPAVLVGVLTGRWLLERIPQRLFEHMLLAFAVLAALRLTGAF